MTNVPFSPLEREAVGVSCNDEIGVARGLERPSDAEAVSATRTCQKHADHAGSVSVLMLRLIINVRGSCRLEGVDELLQMLQQELRLPAAGQHAHVIGVDLDEAAVR